ncbi:MAG: hypothetical protein HYY18_16080 [Planctomycetes bacterium]|nr:hypothetical protein [Planctomycetota bacterium]
MKIEMWRTAKDISYQLSITVVRERIGLLEELLAGFDQVLEDASPTNIQDDRVVLFGAAHSSLLTLHNAISLLLEGQFSDSLGLIGCAAAFCRNSLVIAQVPPRFYCWWMRGEPEVPDVAMLESIPPEEAALCDELSRISAEQRCPSDKITNFFPPWYLSKDEKVLDPTKSALLRSFLRHASEASATICLAWSICLGRLCGKDLAAELRSKIERIRSS